VAPRPPLPPFQRFLDDHRDAVWRYLAAAVGRHDADDCFQETFMAALRAYDDLRGNPRAWVMTIAHRKAIDLHRTRARVPLPLDELPEPRHDDPPAGEDPLWERVRALPPKQRAAVTLRYAGDLTHAEVAVALGCSEDAARRSAHEGLKKLREEVAA
jgi:RNA polymerase sigma factor (sigma-70 family)